MSKHQSTASATPDGGRGWQKPERDRHAKAGANGTDATDSNMSAFAMTT